MIGLLAAAAIVALALVLVTGFLWARGQLNDSAVPISRSLIPPGAPAVVLAVWAHPDDEITSAGTLAGLARDGAMVSLLYLRDGVWEGRRILPPGWVDYARTPTWQQTEADGRYGAHWWLGIAGPDTFSANGHEGQYTVVVPELDLVMVRHGRTATELGKELRAWIGSVVHCFRP